MNAIIYIVIALSLIIFYYFKRTYSYWTRKGIQQIDMQFPLGYYQDLLYGKSWTDITADSYAEFKRRGVKHGGVYAYNKVGYVPLDLEIIKEIMVKDFDVFMDRGMYYNEDLEPLTAHLFSLEGNKWKIMRNKLTPTMTSGKMKMMHSIFQHCSLGLVEVLSKYVGKGEPVNIKDIFSRYTTDVIGNCVFGVECDSLRNPDSDFRKYIRKLGEMSWTAIFCNVICYVIPKSLSTFIGVRVLGKDIHTFFMNVVNGTVTYREQHGISRPDVMQLLLQLKNEGYITNEENSDNDTQAKQSCLTLEEVAAQCFVFFLAGYETSSIAMTFALFELACNQEIQDRLRKEISEVLDKHKQEMTYEAVMEMHFLERVIQESLRMYPPLPAVQRVCSRKYNVPGTDLTLDKGTVVNILIHGIQRDPDYYPDPEKFDPDRFTDEHKSTRPSLAFMPFGEGPRHCIGLRFGLLQSKIGLASVIKNFRFSLDKKTRVPLETDPASFLFAAKGSIWLNAHKLEP